MIAIVGFQALEHCPRFMHFHNINMIYVYSIWPLYVSTFSWLLLPFLWFEWIVWCLKNLKTPLKIFIFIYFVLCIVLALTFHVHELQRVFIPASRCTAPLCYSHYTGMQILWAFALRSHACICPRNAKTHSGSAGEEKEFKTLNKDKKRYTVDSGDAEMSVLSH